MKISESLSKAIIILGSIFFFFLFLVFTYIVRTDSLRQWDFNTTVRLQDDVPLRLDPFFSFLSVIGRFEFTIVLLIIILVFRRKLLAIVPFCLFGFSHVIEIIGKSFLNQPGPPIMFLRSQFSDFPGLYVNTNASYPSGHAMRTVFLAVLSLYIIWKTNKLNSIAKGILIMPIVALAFFMLLSRVSLGEHWTTDVIGGSFLGAAFAFLSLLFI